MTVTNETMPDTLTDSEADALEKGADALPETLTDAEADALENGGDAFPETLTDAEADALEKRGAGLPETLTDAEADALEKRESVAGGVLGEIAAQGREIAVQGAAGVVRDIPRRLSQVASVVLPGETPNPNNPQGSGMAGFTGQVTEEVEKQEQDAAWDDPRRTGWAAVPGSAARSLAPNLLAAVATRGGSVAAMPVIYGGARAQEVYARLREKAQNEGAEFDETAARLQAAGAGALEGGLEYVSNLFGVNKQVRELARGGAKTAAREAAKGIAAGLRRLAGSMLKEGGTEFIQEGGGELHEQIIGISDALEKRPESLADVDWQAVWDAAKYAAAAGGLSSGAVSAIDGTTARVRERRAAAERSARARQAGEIGAAPVDGLALQAEAWEEGTEDGGQRTEDGNAGSEIEEQGAAGVEPAAAGDGAGDNAAAAENAPGAGQVTPERVAQAEEEARKADAAERARRERANAGMGAAVSDELLQTNPVKARVLELGGIRMDGTEDQRGIPVTYRSKNPNAQTLDKMLREIQGDPALGEATAGWDEDDLIEALQGSEREKAKRLKDEGGRIKDPEERAWLKSGSVTVGPENLALGFEFSVRGVPYRVADMDASGYLIERADGKENGWGYRLDGDGLMNIDKGSLRSANGRKVDKITVRARPEDLARFGQARAERDAAARAEAEALGLPVEDQRGDAETQSGEEDEDVPFRMGEGAAAEQTETAEPQRPAARGIRVVRRGYDAERSAADDPAYSRFGQNGMDLPELVELAEDLLDGKTPRVVKRVNPTGTALGSVRFGKETNAAGEPVYGRPETITTLAANYKLISDDEERDWRRQADEIHGAGSDAAAEAFGEVYMRELRERAKRGPRLAMAVLAHEIGHVADQMTRYGMVKLDRSEGRNRLNLLGRVGGMIAYTRDILSADPAGDTINAAEVRRLQGLARRNVRPDQKGKELWRAVTRVWGDELTQRPELKGVLSAKDLQAALETVRDKYPALSEWYAMSTWQEQTRMVQDALTAFANPGTQAKEARRMGSAWFRQEFVRLLEERRQAHLGKMYSELESLIAWWNNGDRSAMDRYFERPAEMFAEAFGAFLNNPGAVQRRAPTFYTTLMAYMEARPQVLEWLDGFNAAMQAGPENVEAHRHRRVAEMFTEKTRRERRQVYDAARRKVGKRTAWDMAMFTGISKSKPLRSAVRMAERLGLKGMADSVSEMADKVENLRGLEELYRTLNLEIGQILDEGDLTVADFDTWALYDMVARSPAYVDKANPRGLHPATAATMRERFRRQLGDQRANTLERAVERAQEIWQQEIVARLEAWGGLDEGTLKYIKENPIYFTLQVGMDDAELRRWQKALQENYKDPEAVTALMQRSLDAGGAGNGAMRAPGAEIVGRKGTLRPAVSLLGATMLKGQALLNAAAHNELARQTQRMLAAMNDPMYTPIPEGETGRDTLSQVVVKYRQDGKEVAYYAPKNLGHFVRGDNPLTPVNTMVQSTKFYALHRMLKMWQTIMSVRFITTQPFADRKAWNTQMPGVRTPFGNVARGSLIGGMAQMIPASTWFLPAGMFPEGSRERMMRPMRALARAYYRTGKIDPKIRSLIERGMYDLGGAWQGMMGDNPHPGEILGGTPLGTTPKSFETYGKDVDRAAKAMRKLGEIPALGALVRGGVTAFRTAQQEMYNETLANKLAGMEYLDKKFPDMPEREKREWVLMGAGNPNFASRSGADPLTDTFLWAFFNPAKEGWRSAWHAAKNDTKGFAMRAAYYNLLPNVMSKAAKLGLLSEIAGRVIGALFADGGEPEEEEAAAVFLRGLKNWERLFARVSSYYGRRHVAIPIMPIGAESALTITIPQAQSFAPLNALINVGLDEAAQAAGLEPDDDKGVEKAMQAVTEEVQAVPALLGMSRGMIQQTLGPLLSIMLEDKDNIYDPFYGRMMLDREEEALIKGGRFTARALPAWSKLFKNAWNSAFGSMLGRFDTKTLRADSAQKTELQKILTAPGVGTIIGGWLRVTGGGEYESIQELFAPEEAERARMTIMAHRAAAQTLASEDGRFPEWASEMYANNPEFARSYNRFRLRSEIYSDLTAEQKVLINRANPRWKRELILTRQLQEKE